MKTVSEFLKLGCALLVFLGPAGYVSIATAQTTGAFTRAGNMNAPRSTHTATLLQDGRVLIAGGDDMVGDDIMPSTAELYDPAIGTFTPTGDMTTWRISHTATLLQDGRVLIAGGAYGPATQTAELYDPATGRFTSTGNMLTAQGGFTATLLGNGKVLFSGGGKTLDGCPDAIVADPELYDPLTGTFSAAEDYAEKTVPFSDLPDCVGYGLVFAPATLLPDGRVFIAAEPTAELYDPSTGAFTLTGETRRWIVDVYDRRATLLINGNVLLEGGYWYDPNAQLYDSSRATFTATGTMTRGRYDHTATLLADGTVLIAGGQLGPGSDASAELYDPSTGTFSPIGNTTSPRYFHTATLLNDGRVLITGGPSGYGFYSGIDYSNATAEVYTPR